MSLGLTGNLEGVEDYQDNVAIYYHVPSDVVLPLDLVIGRVALQLLV